MDPMMLAHGATPAHRHLRSRLAGLLMTTVVLDLVASVAIWRLERHQAGTAIRSLGDALFWTSTQLLTVSSQFPNPISPPARVLDVLLQMYAISIVAILAGSLGAFFHGRTTEEHAAAHVGAEPASGDGRARAGPGTPRAAASTAGSTTRTATASPSGAGR